MLLIFEDAKEAMVNNINMLNPVEVATALTNKLTGNTLGYWIDRMQSHSVRFVFPTLSKSDAVIVPCSHYTNWVTSVHLLLTYLVKSFGNSWNVI